MPLDPQAQVALDAAAAIGLPPNHTVSAQEARANSKLRPRPAGPEVAKVEDRNIPGPGGEIPVRIYTPAGSGPFPILVWFHGGGWGLGDLEQADGVSRHLTVGAGCVVVSVDYRLAPETKFPGPADDCYAATEWASENAASINGDPSSIAVGGDSAGGNLATAICLMARDQNGPALAFQLLVYPVTMRDFETVSYEENASGYSLTRDSMKWFWNHYLASDADASNPYAAPMQAKSLKGLPPALVITAQYDPLRDEGEDYAHRLQDEGVSTKCTRYDGMMHGFFANPSVFDKGKIAVDEASAAMKGAFGR